MARNKYPEETVNLILDVALRLFIEKGYDETSIQDIIEQLGGLSKGAIYHHFKSKESILIAVYARLSDSMELLMQDIMQNPQLSGLEKLQQMFASSLKTPEHLELFAVTPSLLDNPRLLAVQLKSTIEVVIPRYMEPAISEGVRDGSIQTAFPTELAEVMTLLSNIWLNPLVYPMTTQEMLSKIAFFDHLMQVLGIPINLDDLKQQLLNSNRLEK